MVTFSPKQQFQRNNDERVAWALWAESALMHKVITYTEAELVMMGVSEFELAGVRKFITILLNMSEDIVQGKPLPVKQVSDGIQREKKPEGWGGIGSKPVTP